MDRLKNFVFILNGKVAESDDLRHLVSWVRDKGHTVLPRVTWERGDAAGYAREAAEVGADAVVAIGGDGTVNEVLNGLTGYDVPLGIIPLGTANDFARQAGIPLDVDHAMDVILRRKPRRVDTAELNGRRFLNVSTAGVGAEATAETSTAVKGVLGPLAYALTGLKKLAGLEARRATFHWPGVERVFDYLVFAVGNARLTGGGTAVTPEASVTDGLLDLMVVEKMPRSEFARLALKIKRGEHLEEDGVTYLQIPWVTVESARAPIAVNVDGESQHLQKLEYKARPMDLLLFLPKLPEEPDEE
jgi:diacylglycerol kinase (ATP)